MNTTASNDSMPCVPDPYVNTVVFPCLYSILFLVALALNSLAAWTFFKVPTTSTFVVYLKNVVVADILMTLTIPVKVLYYAGVSPSHLCVFYCRYSSKLFYFCMYNSIAFLGLISLDRYLKIVRPYGEYTVQKVRVGQALSATVWAVALSVVIPNVILINKPPPHQLLVGSDLETCASLYSEFGLIVYEASIYFCQVVFWGTLALMVVCYTFISRTVYKSYKASRSSSEKPKTKAKVFVVVAVFFICFGPFHFAIIPYILTQTRNNTAIGCREKNNLYIASETTVWLSTTNSCLDPLIYIFLCKTFWPRLVATLTCKLEQI